MRFEYLKRFWRAFILSATLLDTFLFVIDLHIGIIKSGRTNTPTVEAHNVHREKEK